MKHGAYANVCLEGEDFARFKMLLLSLLAEYEPVGFEENLLIREITQTIWRKNRFAAAEALAIQASSYVNLEGKEEQGDVAWAIGQDAGAYGTIPRCLAAEDLLDRRLWRLFDRLRKIQKKRGFYPWKSRVVDKGASDRPADEIVQVSGSKDSHPPRARPSTDRPGCARTHPKGPPENDRDRPSPASDSGGAPRH